MKKGQVDTQFQVQATLDILPLFDVFVEPYKTVNGHPIEAHILVPKGTSVSDSPVLVKLHGGGWHEGNSDHWWRPWTLELALKHNAIVVSPDYRLMPESQFSDIIDDLRDFWHWVEHDFKELSGLRVDLSNLAIVGESAGGYLAAQSVLLGLSSQVAIVMLQYPALAIQSLLDSVAQGESDCNAQKVAVSVLDEYLAKVDPSTLLTRALFGSRMDIALASIKSGRLVDLTRYPHFDPMTSLETAGKVPPIFLFHGLDDTSVAASASKAWVEKLKTTHPDVPVYTSFIPGEHVLDHDHTLGEPWLEEPITFVEQYWPVR